MDRQTYLENFTGCYLDPNHIYSVEENDGFIAQQLTVDIYRDGLGRELDAALRDPEWSWLDLFTKFWREPDMYGLKSEADARELAVDLIWKRLHPNQTPPELSS